MARTGAAMARSSHLALAMLAVVMTLVLCATPANAQRGRTTPANAQRGQVRMP